jgi:nucleotide-binding universal stress UspA family protein
MSNIVIVGVDDSETASKAATEAAHIAKALGARLHIVSAFEHDTDEIVGTGSDTWRVGGGEIAAQVAGRIANTLRDVHDDITAGAVEGNPADVLVAEAKRLEAQIIVVGNRRMQGIGRVLGSVANSVAHTAPCDVYIVKTV